MPWLFRQPRRAAAAGVLTARSAIGRARSRRGQAVPPEVLQPRRHYEAAGRLDEYRAWVDKMMTERRAFLQSYDVDPAIIAATAAK